MLEQLKQVGMTYITWRELWSTIPMMSVIVLSGFLVKAALVFSLGIPSLLGMIGVVAVVKWQFANPRARLLPGYTGPHLMAFGLILLMILVINPILLSFRHGMSPSGPLAFTLLLGGCLLMSLLLSRWVFLLPAITIFFGSFLVGPAHSFWFGDFETYRVIHLLLALLGCGIVSYCLWYLSQLTEEMNEYQVWPIGETQSSRVLRAEQRRFVGGQIKKAKISNWLTDRWLDQGLANRDRHTTLVEYGFARVSSGQSALFYGVAYFLCGMLLMQFGFMRLYGMVNGFMRDSSSSAIQAHPPTLLFLFAALVAFAVFHAVFAGMVLMLHRPRMAQELLRPANRASYFDSLFFAMAKRSAWLWASLLGALGSGSV